MTSQSAPAIRTAKEVREWFRQNGISIASWAAEHNFNTNLVYDILSLNPGKRNLASFGQSHKIAVALRMKPAPDQEMAA